jgi:hypothetical protein
MLQRMRAFAARGARMAGMSKATAQAAQVNVAKPDKFVGPDNAISSPVWECMAELLEYFDTTSPGITEVKRIQRARCSIKGSAKIPLNAAIPIGTIPATWDELVECIIKALGPMNEEYVARPEIKPFKHKFKFVAELVCKH